MPALSFAHTYTVPLPSAIVRVLLHESVPSAFTAPVSTPSAGALLPVFIQTSLTPVWNDSVPSSALPRNSKSVLPSWLPDGYVFISTSGAVLSRYAVTFTLLLLLALSFTVTVYVYTPLSTAVCPLLPAGRPETVHTPPDVRLMRLAETLTVSPPFSWVTVTAPDCASPQPSLAVPVILNAPLAFTLLIFAATAGSLRS